MLFRSGEEMSYWETLEESSSLYTLAVNEEPVIPEYDFLRVNQELTRLREKLCVLKHAINTSNINSVIEVEEKVYSVDQILVMMTLLNKRKKILDGMRKRQEKTRINSYSSRMVNPEYQYINYKLVDVKAEYDFISKQLIDLQMALDRYNQTFEFEVEI